MDAMHDFAQELDRAYETTSLLIDLCAAMETPAQPREFVRGVCRRLAESVQVPWVAIVLDPGATPDFTAAALESAGRLPFASDAFLARVASVRNASQLTSRRDRLLPPGNSLCERPECLACIEPIEVAGLKYGVLIAGDKGDLSTGFTSHDFRAFEAAARHVAGFLRTCSLYAQQRRMFMGTLKALTAAIDAKDRYTRGHSERVAWFSASLARAAGFSEPQAQRVHLAGLLHDVGKIGVPEAVLCKPGKLDDAEFGWIKKHPEIGNRILADIPDLADILPGVMHHHERYDGRGYPHGLSGANIPPMARIIAVADTFDALSSTRSYRTARTRDFVLSEINRSAGGQLDPAFAALALELDLRPYDVLLAQHAAAEPVFSSDASTRAA